MLDIEEIRGILISHLEFGSSEDIQYLYENKAFEGFEEVLDTTFYRGIVLSNINNLKTKSYGVASTKKGIAMRFASELLEDDKSINILLTIPSSYCTVIINMKRVYEHYKVTRGFEDYINTEEEYYIEFNNCNYEFIR